MSREEVERFVNHEVRAMPRTLTAVLFSACAALLIGLVVYVLQAPMPLPPFDGERENSLSRVVFKVLAAPLVTLWCYSACRRCTDRFVRRCMVAVCALCLFWILDTLVKYPCHIDWVVRLLWYLFYIPIIFIPLVCSWIAFYLWRGGRGDELHAIQGVTFAVSAALLALVLTNGVHHLVFVFDYEDPSWDSVYNYGPGYWLVLVWLLALVAFCPVALLLVARTSLRRAVAFLLVPLGLIGAYVLLYILRVPIAFSSSLAMISSIFILATFEAALRMGLVPVQGHQLEVFAHLPFELEVFDDAGELCYRTDASARDPRFGGLAPHVRYEKAPLSTGYAVTAKDTTLVDEIADELEETRGKLERQHALLESEYGIDARIRVQQELESLYDEVAVSLGRALRRAGELLEQAAEERGADPGEARWRSLAEAKLLLGLCKQKGQCIVDAHQRTAFKGDYLKLGTSEACANMRALGIECAMLLETEELSAQALCLLYDKLYAWGICVLEDDAPTIVARVSGESGLPHVRFMIECDSAADALSRRKDLAASLGEVVSDTAWILDEGELSVSAPLTERAAGEVGAR